MGKVERVINALHPHLNSMDWSLITAFLEGLRPAERTTIDIWADKYVNLTTESSKEAGPWRTDRTPYLREILVKLSPTDPARKIVFVKGAQIGATVSGIIAMLAYVVIDPCPMIYVMPTIAIAEGFSKDKLQPMIDGCDLVRQRIKDRRTRDSGNTVLGKRGAGWSINMAGANSAASLRSRTAKFITADEIDAYPRNIENEGSPLTLLEKRQSTFGNQAKLYIPSTPTVENASEIWLQWERTDQRFYHVPCPECGVPHIFEFENFIWTPGRPETVKMQCPHCVQLYPERFKEEILIAGEWISTIPERRNPYIIGYHLSSLYSPYGWLSWEKVVNEYEEALEEISASQEDNKMRAHYNTTRGLVYATSGERPEWKKLYENNRESYSRGTINNNVKVITAGVDVQKDRIEVEIVGWGYMRRAWSVNYHIIEGEIGDPNVQETLSNILSMKFMRPDQIQVPISKVCIDANYNSTEVYMYISAQDTTKYVAIHGSATTHRIFSNPQYANKTAEDGTQFTARYYMLGVDLLKDEVYTQLKKTKDVDDPLGPPGFCHFPEYDDVYFMGITAEQKMLKTKGGANKYEYVKKFQRNEPLDCRNYARAALAMVGYDEFGDACLDQMFKNYQRVSVGEVKKKKKTDDYW